MLRRLLLLSGLAALLVAAPLAQSAEQAGPIVRIRVEGKTTTIFGATQPRASAATALEALEAASIAGEFHYVVTKTDFGPYVSQIGRYPSAGSGGWVFKVNHVSPPVGVDKVVLKDGDIVLWYWATFTEAGGPPTLDLKALPRTPNCYSVGSVDDGGASSDAGRVTLKVDGRSVSGPGTRTCVGSHRGLVRATKPGAVRSNALP